VAGLGAAGYAVAARSRRGAPEPIDRTGAAHWQMPPLADLGRASMPARQKIGMGVLRTYLAVASVLVVVRIVQLAVGR
jgi:hypothetical protein